MQVRMADLGSQYRRIRDELEPALLAVLASGRYILGEHVQALEQEVAQACKARFAIGVSSGTDALKLALRAVGVQPGDEVITTPFTFVSTTEVIVQLGAVPVFVDIDPETYNLDPNLVESAITPRTRAILPVSLYGQSAEMRALREVADRYGLWLIEDAAQAIGARHYEEPIGAFAHAATLSFFPTKNIGAAGDAGMVITNDEQIAYKVRSLRVHGMNGGYYYEDIGYTARLDELQAVILRAKLRYLDSWTERRRYHATLYRTLLADAPLQLPVVRPYNYHVYHQFTVRTPQRDALRDYLREQGIESAVYYPLPLHLQPAYRFLGYNEGDFPHAERAAQQVLSLPVHSELTEDQIAFVAQSVLEFAQTEVIAV
ncbi:MAG: DegT/DnrJ/EryC1/StrS family aminotransferase [Fimbriimonadales bacterium]|nr:DegT/DnrJ/EryC1/StrS family aminotransferase [Fimbriimonadales bacterium]